jgi:hypothetical protein
MSQTFIPPTTGTYAGMNRAQLLQLRVDLQTALFDIAAGRKPQVVAYGTGDGTKSVTFARTTVADIRAMIAEINAHLGAGRRRAAPVYFT